MTQRATHVRGAETDLRGVRERFGGIDTRAALGGMFAAFGVLVFLSALIAAGAGNIDYQLNAIDPDGNLQEVELVGSVVALLVVLAAFLVGGWVAARMARFDGVFNGLGVALWAILLVVVFAALGAFVGAEYNSFQQAGLPDWFSQFRGDDVTTAAVIAGVAGLVAVFLGSVLGGALGEAYNRKVNAAITDETLRRERI